MAKLIRTTVDAEGNVHVDLSGFVGEECLREDRGLHEDLAQLGLVQVLDSRFKKTSISVRNNSVVRDRTSPSYQS